LVDWSISELEGKPSHPPSEPHSVYNVGERPSQPAYALWASAGRPAYLKLYFAETGPAYLKLYFAETGPAYLKLYFAETGPAYLKLYFAETGPAYLKLYFAETGPAYLKLYCAETGPAYLKLHCAETVPRPEPTRRFCRMLQWRFAEREMACQGEVPCPE